MASMVIETSVPTNGAPPVVKEGGDSVAALTAAKAATALVVTDAIPFAAALAVLVADGANPTQAHVTTANNAYTTLAAAIAAADVAVAAAQAAIPSGDVVVTVNLATITKRYTLTKAFDAIKFYLSGSGSIPE